MGNPARIGSDFAACVGDVDMPGQIDRIMGDLNGFIEREVRGLATDIRVLARFVCKCTLRRCQTPNIRLDVQTGLSRKTAKGTD